MNQHAKHYTHSGELGSSLLLVPIGGLIAAAVLAVAYAYISVYSPIAGWVSILFVLGFGFGQGLTVGQIGFLAKCRNPGLVTIVGLLTGVVALYLSWAVFEFALLKRYEPDFDASLVTLVLSPQAIWDMAKAINEEGWYSIKSFTPKGTLLWIFWAIEAALVVGLSAHAARFRIKGEVFCERCNAWCMNKPEPIRLAVPGSEEEVDEEGLEKIAAGDIDTLRSLGAAPEDDDPHIEVEIISCDQCNSTATFQTKLVYYEVDKKGNVEKNERELSEQILMTPDEHETLTMKSC